jgi:hypothetical protein
MRERGHVINAVLLAVGIGVLLEPDLSRATLEAVVGIGVPVLLGALFPDIDTTFGTHRKTFHNVVVLGAVAAFPVVFGNLAYVWLGVLTHYVLDLLGNVRGMALFWPLPGFYDVPVGVNIDSRWADVVTLAVTGVELAVAAALIRAGRAGVLGDPTNALDLVQVTV